MAKAHKASRKASGNEMTKMTTADLVVLCLLSEGPCHGYELFRTLEAREVGDWLEISQAQVYYSMKKLARLKLIEPSSRPADTGGPDRKTYIVRAPGRRAMAASLANADWTTEYDGPRFLTWLALSTYASRNTVLTQFQRRQRTLQRRMNWGVEALRVIREDEAEMSERTLVAALITELTIHQFETELSWLKDARSRLMGRSRRPPRPPTRRPTRRPPRPRDPDPKVAATR